MTRRLLCLQSGHECAASGAVNVVLMFDRIGMNGPTPGHPWAADDLARRSAVSDIMNEQTEDEILETEISDEALEAAAFAGKLGAYTEFAYCTQVACPL
jgi:hypothetical protein